MKTSHLASIATAASAPSSLVVKLVVMYRVERLGYLPMYIVQSIVGCFEVACITRVEFFYLLLERLAPNCLEQNCILLL